MDVVQAAALPGGSAPLLRVPRLQGQERLRLRCKTYRGRAAARRGYLPGRQPEFLEYRRSGGDRLVLRHQRTPGLRGPCLPLRRGILPGEAALSGRRHGLQIIRGAVSVPPGVASLQHAGGRNLREGRLPAARARGEEGLRGDLRPAKRVLAALRCEQVAGSAELPEEQSEGSGELLPRPVPGPEAA